MAMVGGPKLPPPLTYINYKSSASNRSAINALLHQVYASCGRVFLFLTLAMPFLIASCSQGDTDVAPLTPMHQMYDESVNLTQVQMDSITNFCVKFSGYVNRHPQSMQDEYFDPTIQNVRTAAALYGYDIKVTTITTGVTINDEWDGEIVINFD